MRSIDFHPERAKRDVYFQAVVRAIAGITCPYTGSLLTSVPVEIVFNDMRDAAKRFSKSEITSASNLHSIVSRSCHKRMSGVETLIPAAHDWSFSLNGKTVKKTVFDTSRSTDASVGVNSSGLTRKRTDSNLTKPHIFSFRLHLIEVLHELWMESDDQSNFSAEVMYRKLWKSCLVETGVLMSVDHPRMSNKLFIVCVPGPYSVACLEVDTIEEVPNGCTLLDNPKFVRIPIIDIDMVKVAVSTPIVLKDIGRLGWVKEGDWMTLPAYVAHQSILRIRAQLLSSLCSDMKIRGHSKLDHKRKVELFLKHMGCDQTYIENIMAQLPEKEPRAKKTTNNDDDDDNPNQERVDCSIVYW